MVNHNWGLPELPDNSSNENLPSVNELIVGTDTDTDEDDGYNGYEPLPMSAADAESNESESDDEISTDGAVHQHQQQESQPPVSRIDVSLLKEVWSAPVPKAVDIEMDSEKVNAVKEAMLNITLPSSSIPEWANSVPEEEWKEELTRRLQNMLKK